MVAKFLEAVREFNPEYWVMENVPNIERTLRKAWLLDRKHIRKSEVEEYLLSKQVERLDCRRYGVPQKRTRLFSGKFILPDKSTEPPLTLGEIIESFPYPEPMREERPEGAMTDPVYGFRIPYSRLRDHFMESRLDDQHVRISRREKRFHNWAGEMKFPDRLDAPSRTICATSVKSGRQAIVIRDPRRPSSYRTPTIRECATLQGFPLTYQFWGSTLTKKQTLVGNAVPPPVARSIATAILKDMRKRPRPSPLLFAPRELAGEARNGHNRIAHRFGLGRTFDYKMPGTPASCRVDFDNQGRSPLKHPCGTGTHLCEWRAVLYLEYAKHYVAWPLSFELAMKIAMKVFDSTLDPESHKATLERVIRQVTTMFAGQIPDASSLQATWANRLDLSHGPDWVLEEVDRICRQVAGEPKGSSIVSADEFARFFEGIEPDSHGDDYDFDSGKWRQEPVNMYTMCSAVAVSAASILTNKGVEWLRNNWGRHYNDLTIGAFGPFPERLREVVDADFFAPWALA